jgi:hypothetical protein
MAGVSVLWVGFFQTWLAADIITAQQKNLALDPGFRMMPFGIDAALSQFRWAVNQRLEEEKQQMPEAVQGA